MINEQEFNEVERVLVLQNMRRQLHIRLRNIVDQADDQTLLDLADLTIDNCAPPGDSMVEVPGVDVRVGPGSTIGNSAVVNTLKVLVAERLAAACR